MTEAGLSFFTSPLLISWPLNVSRFSFVSPVGRTFFYIYIETTCMRRNPHEVILSKINKLLFVFPAAGGRAKLSCDKSRSIAHAVQLGVFITETAEHTAKNI